MTSENLREMIDYTKEWKTWLENVEVKQEEEKNKKNFIKQMDDAIKKWEKELADNSEGQE